MSLLPDVHLSLDRLTIQHIYELFLPLLPGGTFVIGFMLVRPDLVAYFAVASGLGYFSRVATMVFAAYIAGVLLWGVSVQFASSISLGLSSFVYKIPAFPKGRMNTKSAQARTWRIAAAEFLGPRLVPRPPAGGNMFTTADHFAQPAPIDVQNHDMAWNDWFIILQDYVLRGTPVLAPSALMFWIAFQATAWALIIVTIYSHVGRHHWVILVVLALLVLATSSAQFSAVVVYRLYDRLSAPDLIARLLVEIRAKDSAEDTSTRPAASAPPPAP